MKIALFVVCCAAINGCAHTRSVPVNLIITDTTMSNDTIRDTYLIAQDIFESSVACVAPKVGTLVIRDATLLDLNYGRNVWAGNGEISVAIGTFNNESSVLMVSQAHPDKPRVLFHELIHFMFNASANCQTLAASEEVQHKIIAVMTREYFKRTKRLDYIPGCWLNLELKKLGISVKMDGCSLNVAPQKD